MQNTLHMKSTEALESRTTTSAQLLQRERISSGSEMHTFSFQTATFTYVFAMSGSSNIKGKNACASGGPLGANQCLPVEIYCLKIPKTVVMLADFGIDNKD